MIRSKVWSNFHQLKNRGFFRYLGRNILLILLIYTLLITAALLMGRYLVDFELLFQSVIDRLSDRSVVGLFFLSESFTGMIPVDLFVIWTQKFSHPMLWLLLLGILSYAGAVISFGIGKQISRMHRFRAFTERRLSGYIDFTRKWGGAFIVIAALFPFTPFSLVVIAIAMFHYPFRLFLLFAMTRLVRFVIQGAIFFDVLRLDTLVS